jgi:glycosyltransferase family protein
MESNVSNDREYFDASFTRFYIDLRDKSQVPEMVTLIKQIWKDRDVYLVEGYSSRLGVGNNLFMGANSVKRILCPSQNAFSKYNEIIFKIEHLVPHNALILIALGMTATVLAYDLSKLGYQAIDIGHIDVEYCWFKMQAKYKCTIPGKAVNEVGVPNNYSKCNDKDYKESILLHIV